MCVCVRECGLIGLSSVCVRESVWADRFVDTGWRRLIGSPKLQIIFHKRATKYRSLLRKMTYKDKGSYESSPLCICRMAALVNYVT